MSIEDVTERVNGSVKSGMSAAEANAAQTRCRSLPLKPSQRRPPGLRSDVVTLYQGGQYNFIATRNIRMCGWFLCRSFRRPSLAAIPTTSIFRDSISTWRWCRVYENNQPVKVENYFKWSKTGAKDGELVFVTGHPGFDSRLEHRGAS